LDVIAAVVVWHLMRCAAQCPLGRHDSLHRTSLDEARLAGIGRNRLVALPSKPLEQSSWNDQSCAANYRRPYRQPLVGGHLVAPLLETTLEGAGAPERCLRSDLECAPGRLLIEELSVPGIPIVELGGEALHDLLAGALHRWHDAGADGRVVLRKGMLNGPANGEILWTALEPRLIEHFADKRFGIFRQRVVIEVRGGAGLAGVSIRLNLDEVEPLGHCERRLPSVGDLLGQRHEQPRRFAKVGRVHKDATMLEIGVMALDREINNRVK